MSNFYTADLHFFHKNIIAYCDRPYVDVEQMNQALVENFNSMVGPEDTIYFLGDIAFKIENLWPLNMMNGYKILVAGNHDLCWVGHKKYSPAAVEDYYAYFDHVYNGNIEDFSIGEHLVTLSHFPYHGDSHDKGATDRYAKYRPVNKGQINVCGHVHEAWTVQERSINVGVDVWNWYPVPESDLLATIEKHFPNG